MTRLLDEAIAKVRGLPPERQDALAHAMLAVAGGDAPEAVETGHLAEVEAGLAEARAGSFASEDEVRTTLARSGE